jgi:hypothetical protein
MACSKAVTRPDGTWYLLVWHASLPEKFHVTVYSLDSKLELTLIGEHASPGHHDIGVLDAVFATNDKLHIVWGSVEPSIAPKVRSNWLRLLSIDLDVQTKAWSDEREIWRMDRFTSSVAPAVHILGDGSIHHLWNVDEGEHRSTASGLFYQAKDSGQTIQLAVPHNGFKSLVVNNQIVVCYALENDPMKVYFRVIRDGKPGPVTSITLAKQPYHALWSDSMVLGSDSDDKFWFIATHDAGTLYQLEVTDGK